MKAIQTIPVLVVLGAIALGQPNSKSAEQRFFNIEDAVQRPAVLSNAELAALAADDLVGKERNHASAGSNLTQEGLAASVFHLCGTSERDVVVVGFGAQYVGANVGPFWIIRDLPSGPIVVLGETSLGLTIEAKRSNKCLNIEAVAATAVQSTTTEFHFNGTKYAEYKSKSVPLN
jgi:hypothetical protein